MKARSMGAIYQRPKTGRLERLLIRLRILATPEEDAYYSWADERLDYLAALLRSEKKAKR